MSFDDQILEKKTGYRGSLVKRSGIQVEWTPEMVEEYMRCANDPIYFIETYMKLVHVDRGLVPFSLYPYQKEIIKTVVDSRNTIICTCRQAGKTSSIVGFACWYVLFNPDKNIALLANKASTAREILNRVQLAYQHIPKWLQQGVVELNKGSITLENNSRIIADATSSDAIRGWSFSVVIIDEAAHIDGWDDFFASVYPTISSGQTTKLIQISTPFGLNHFYKTWINAVEKRNDYKHIMVTWQEVPGRDEKWRQETLASMNFDKEKFAVEFENQFLGSSGTLIGGWKLKELVHRTPIAQNEGLYQYALPQKDRMYVLVSDVSEGKGLDYSTFQVIDITDMPYSQVAVYRNNWVTPGDFASIIHQTAVLYNRCPVLIENNGIGSVVSDAMFYEYDYDNSLSTVHAGRSGKRISSGFGPGAERGIRTTKNVKQQGCSLLKLLVEQNQLIINDANTIEELSTFSRKGQTYEAEQGCHDDLVMPLVLFGWMTDQPYFKEMTDINTIQKLRDQSEEDIIANLLPFGIIDDGHDIELADSVPPAHIPDFNWDF